MLNEKNVFDIDFNKDLTLKKPLTNDVEDLIITGRFPPLTDTSGLVLSKRIINSNKKVDVIAQNYFSLDLKTDDSFNSVIENYVDNKILIESPGPDTVYDINKFRKEGLSEIYKLNRKYKNIYSRSWTMNSHFLALDYKIENPDVIWTAEFSDPLRYDINKNLRQDSELVFDDDEYLDKINRQISKLNDEKGYHFDLISNKDSRYFLVEYLSFLFADNIVFTNTNQRKFMLSNFSNELKFFVLPKSILSRHPTLSEDFYHLKESDYVIDENYINFSYFGTFYGKRHLEYLFFALDSLSNDIKEKIRFHIFSNEDEIINDLVADLSIKENIIINGTVDFLEFLNLTTKMDILIVNDTITRGAFDVNPYLPSKISDYLGSGKDIWVICEENSMMSRIDVKYKSYVEDYPSTLNTLYQILEDFGLDINKRTPNINGFYQKRLTSLNEALYSKFKQKGYWINRFNLTNNDLIKLKKEYKEYVEVEKNNLENELKQYKNLSSEYIEINKKLTEENNSLKSDITNLKNINNDFEEKNKKLSNQNNALQADNLNIKNEYMELHKITQNSFNQIEDYKSLINFFEEEILYYKKKESIFNKLISNPLSYLYIYLKVPKNERNLTISLFKKIKYNSWFNKKFYLEEYDDLSQLWTKILSPELHFVCNGLDEWRVGNKNSEPGKSKKDLLKLFEYKY